MNYLEHYDATTDPRDRVALVSRWIRTDWRPFFAELRVDGRSCSPGTAPRSNWREKGLMRAVLRPEDLPHVRRLARRYAEKALDRAAATERVEVVGALGRYVPAGQSHLVTMTRTDRRR